MTVSNKVQSKVPQLRFPEFDGEWYRRKISDVAVVITGSTPDTSKNEYYVGEFPFVSPFDINDEPFVSETKTTLTKIGFEKGRKVKAGSSLFVCIGSSIGKVARVIKDVVTNQQINAVVVADPMLESFVFYSLKKSSKKIAVLAGEQAVPIINKTQFSKVALNFPISCDEANEIATFLSTVDKKISLLKQKHEQLVQYKKGIMQQLFNQQLRFKDENGQDFPDWEQFHLNEIASPIKRKAAKAIENVMTISAGKGFLHQKERFSQVIAGTSLEKYTLIKEGEFSYNRGNSKSYTYGCIYKLSGDKEALVPFIYRSFKLNKGVADFYAHLFEGKYLDRQLRRLISSSARMDGLLNIGEKDFYKVTVPYPCDDEQEKIAAFIGSLNQKIGLAKQQIEQTQTYKQGLLQQMFV